MDQGDRPRVRSYLDRSAIPPLSCSDGTVSPVVRSTRGAPAVPTPDPSVRVSVGAGTMPGRHRRPADSVPDGDRGGRGPGGLVRWIQSARPVPLRLHRKYLPVTDGRRPLRRPDPGPHRFGGGLLGRPPLRRPRGAGEVPDEVLEVMAPYGIDLRDHRSRQLTEPMVTSADLIIGMGRRHVQEAVLLDPPCWPRAFMLKELVRRGNAVGPRGPGPGRSASWIDCGPRRPDPDLAGPPLLGGRGGRSLRGDPGPVPVHGHRARRSWWPG